MSSRKNILVIDPNDYHVQLLKQVFSNASPPFSLTRAPDLEKGMHLAKDKHFDLILSENLNGLSENAAWIQNIKKLHGKPLIILTTRKDEKEAVTAIKNGADDYLIKNADNLKNLEQILLKTIKKPKNKSHEKPAGLAGINLLTSKLKTISDLLRQPAKHARLGRKKFKEFKLLEKEIENLKSMMRKMIS